LFHNVLRQKGKYIHPPSRDRDKDNAEDNAEDNDNNGKNDEFFFGWFKSVFFEDNFAKTMHIISLRYRTSRFRPGARSLVFDPRETPGREFFHSPGRAFSLSTSTVMDTVESDVFTICNLHGEWKEQ
jgi:hypothetical protein